MVGLREAVSNVARGFVCSAFDISAGASRWVETLRRAGTSVPPPDPAGILPPARALGCDPDFGGGSAGGPGGFGVSYGDPAGFTGGQCATDRYRVTASFDRFVNGSFVTRDVDIVGGLLYRGPIEEVFLTAGNQDVRVRHNNGQISDLQSGDPSSVTYANIGDVSVENVDGPDNCGDGPNLPESDFPSGNTDITYDDENGNPVTEPVTIIGGPLIIDVDGNINVPVEVCLASFCLDVNVNLSTGDIAINFGGNPGDSPCCPSVEPDEDAEDDPEDPDPPMNDQRIWGVKVICIIDETQFQGTIIGQPDGTTLYAPDLGNVRFSIDVGNRRGYTGYQKINSTPQMIPVNAPTTAYDWDILERQGVSYQVIPILVTNEEANAMQM